MTGEKVSGLNLEFNFYKPNKMSKSIKCILLFVIAIAMFIVGGWDIGKLSLFGLNGKAFVWDTIKDISNYQDIQIIAVRVNNAYWGLFCKQRFFDAPVFSYILLVGSLSFFSYFFEALFTPSYERVERYEPENDEPAKPQKETINVQENAPSQSKEQHEPENIEPPKKKNEMQDIEESIPEVNAEQKEEKKMSSNKTIKYSKYFGIIVAIAIFLKLIRFISAEVKDTKKDFEGIITYGGTYRDSPITYKVYLKDGAKQRQEFQINDFKMIVIWNDNSQPSMIYQYDSVNYEIKQNEKEIKSLMMNVKNLFDSSKIIQGYSCKKAQLSSINESGEEEIQEVYYTDKLPSSLDCKNLKGFPLQFWEKGTDGEVLFLAAISIAKQSLPDDLFINPSNCKQMTKEEAWTAIKGGENNNGDKSTIDSTAHEYFCDYDKVSDEYNFSLTIDKMFDKYGNDKYAASLKINSKTNDETIQTIEFMPQAIYMYKECSSRSYINGYNKDGEAVDGMYGDLIIADFNFDGKEDFAIARDMGFTEFYDFYLQQNNNFEKNSFLSANLRGLPEVDMTKKTLTTTNIHGVDEVETQTFQFIPEEISYKLILNEVRNVNTGVLQ